MPTKSVADYTFHPCTCGRVPHDFTQLAVIREEDGFHYGHGAAEKVPRAKVVCMRPGCYGAWKTTKRYAKRLPRLFNLEYIRIKEKEQATKGA
jgi:hypothetical protein